MIVSTCNYHKISAYVEFACMSQLVLSFREASQHDLLVLRRHLGTNVVSWINDR